jgi:hypothetical protein
MTYLKNLAFAAYTGVVLGPCGCTPTRAEAREALAADEVNCSAQYDTKAAIEACRAKVRAEWDISDAGTLLDGGAR